MTTDLVRVISDALYEHLEVRQGFEGPPRDEHDCCAGVVLEALRTAGIGFIDPKATLRARVYTDADVECWVDSTYSYCPAGCDCSCCYGYSEKDCHCFRYPCNCGGGPVEHGKPA